MEIEESDLIELLNKKYKADESKRFPIENIIGFIVYFLSILTSNFLKSYLWLKIFVYIFSFIYIIYIIYLIIKFKTKSYSNKELIKDIKRSNQIRNFSLLVLKDNSNTYKGKFLLRYDKRWKCFLFPYKKTHTENDFESILDYVTNTLSLSNVKIIETKTDDIEKYSVSDEIKKSYHHTFYLIEFDASELKTTVKLNGEKYKWFSIDEMKRNKKIELKNSETVDFVERTF